MRYKRTLMIMKNMNEKFKNKFHDLRFMKKIGIIAKIKELH